MLKKLIFILFLMPICQKMEAQNLKINTDKVFTQKWIYPNITKRVHKIPIMDLSGKNKCLVLPPDSLRVFGQVHGMGCDKNDNLYVWDQGYAAISKFTPDGKKIWRIKLKIDDKEYGGIGGVFAVSENGQVCLGNMETRMITVLDSSGQIIHKFKVNMDPAAITFGVDRTLYIEGFIWTYTGKIIHHYTQEGVFLDSFGNRTADSTIFAVGANGGHLRTDTLGKIYHTNPYPYRVDVFSHDGKLLNQIQRMDKRFEKPKFKNARISFKFGLRGIDLINNMIAVFAWIDRIKNDWEMDLYNADGKLLQTIPSTYFPHKLFRYEKSASDSKGNLYLYINPEESIPSIDADPVIVKYHLNL
jgi:hypothetical protein